MVAIFIANAPSIASVIRSHPSSDRPVRGPHHQDCLLEAVMGALDRLIRRDEQWERISHHIIGDERTRGSSGPRQPHVRRSGVLDCAYRFSFDFSRRNNTFM
ncbi:hypothetical protein RGR602_PB00309 (plasmid) [Rhizobium gallicum bv. gallicum R602sp]|uniref:Uncharacterized protein n=1 Tax=Rhizobium gallicum bv. gallicum R602sp TaxID=1041138 RepID=A0A0B4XB56_9HYPH|nr:hypothetical protein RGR602_PB00309 [Rhizobium gallicum bv. gallicum R602sp]